MTPSRVRLGGNLIHPVVPAGAVDITRRTPWGNPFRVGDYDGYEDEALDACLSDYRRWLTGSDDGYPDVLAGSGFRSFDRVWQRDHLADLAGLDLACWCKFGARCHGDVLLELAAVSDSPR